MIRNALWRTYDSSYAAAKSLLAWSGLGKAYNVREQVALVGENPRLRALGGYRACRCRRR